eukprot:scaffold22612_cov138-Cylindrotheca_fusiformis.AAC.14
MSFFVGPACTLDAFRPAQTQVAVDRLDVRQTHSIRNKSRLARISSIEKEQNLLVQSRKETRTASDKKDEQ